MSTNTEHTIRIPLWDISTRIFHWLFAAGVIFMLVTGYTGSMMEWHLRIGQMVLTAVVFRVLWGIFGSTPVRFRHFLRSPIAAFHHLREFLQRDLHPEAGHNALGGYVVIAMLSLVAVQALSGLFTTDDIFTEGPLVAVTSEYTSQSMGEIHGINWRVLLALVVLHPIAIAAYRAWGRQNLLGPMITGNMTWPADTPAPDINHVSPLRALVCLAAAIALVYGTLALSG